MTLNATRWAKAAVLGAVFSVGCGSTKSNTVTGSDAGSAGDTSTGIGGDATGGSQPVGDAGSSNAGDGGAPGQGEAGASTALRARGAIDLTQAEVDGTFNYDISGSFVRFGSSPAAANGISCAASTIGNCLVEACTISNDADAGTDATPTATALDAGTITITGAGDSTAALMFGLAAPQSTQKGYPSVHADSQFFSGGDSIVIHGAGGADLPAFAAQMVIAPSDVVITAPTCPGLVCPEIDRTTDLAVTWTGGGAGQVRANFETIGPNNTGSVFCTFDSGAGSGVVPKAALAVLGDISDGVTTGLQIFQSMSTVDFTVGDVPTTFTVQSAGSEALWINTP
jgi:hypothetical protein